MAYRRRRSFRRRSSGLRWFQPNLWNASNPQLYAGIDPLVASAAEAFSEVAVTPVIHGNAPFPGVNNAAGLLAGKVLAERQWLNIVRVVGRMTFYVDLVNPGVEVPFTNGGIVSVFWALFRMGTDEQGRPETESGGDFPALNVRDNQDEKSLILAQDVWRTSVPTGTTWLPGDALSFNVEPEPPLYNMIDVRLKRSFRNEQDLYLATQFGIWNPDELPSGQGYELRGLVNLRPLGRFGR